GIELRRCEEDVVAAITPREERYWHDGRERMDGLPALAQAEDLLRHEAPDAAHRGEAGYRGAGRKAGPPGGPAGGRGCRAGGERGRASVGVSGRIAASCSSVRSAGSQAAVAYSWGRIGAAPASTPGEATAGARAVAAGASNPAIQARCISLAEAKRSSTSGV